MTKVILIRHAEAEGNVNRIFHGWYDSELTQKGLIQARRVAERLIDENIDIIYSSDSKRAYGTARAIAELKDLEINVIKDLREFYGGDWENISYDQLERLYPEDLYNFNFCLSKFKAPNGETADIFYSRLVNAIKKIINDNIDKNICVVTHGTAIKFILSYFYSKPIEEIDSIIWGDNTCVSYITIDNDKFEVLVNSDASHLDDELGTLSKQDWYNKEKM